MLCDLWAGSVRDCLAARWDAPASLNPAARAARVTRDIAVLLATVARRLEKRGHTAERSEENTSEPQSLMRTSYAVLCLKKKNSLQEKQHTTLIQPRSQ